MALVLLLASPALGSEAERQLEFASNELRADRYRQAIKSAESALRLDPSLYGAFLLKARAYFDLGDLRTSEAMVVAYMELRNGLPDDPLALGLLRRIREEAPTSHIPLRGTSTLVVKGVPGGSHLRVFIESSASFSESTVIVPATGGDLDRKTGLYLIDATIPELAEGTGGIFISHPDLGEVALDLDLADTATVVVPTSSFEGLVGAQNRWGQWKTSRTKHVVQVLVTASLAGGALGGGFALLAGAERQRRLASGAEERLLELAGSPESVAFQRANLERAQALNRRDILGAAGVVIVGVGTSGVVITIVLGSKTRPGGWSERKTQ